MTPSIDRVDWPELFGLAMIEAMANRTPVVVDNVDGSDIHQFADFSALGASSLHSKRHHTIPAS
jgi:hypothetical protein